MLAVCYLVTLSYLRIIFEMFLFSILLFQLSKNVIVIATGLGSFIVVIQSLGLEN